MSLDHLDYYLDEFTFRFNRRTSRSRGKFFFRLVQQAMVVEPSTYRSIVDSPKSTDAKTTTYCGYLSQMDSQNEKINLETAPLRDEVYEEVGLNPVIQSRRSTLLGGPSPRWSKSFCLQRNRVFEHCGMETYRVLRENGG